MSVAYLELQREIEVKDIFQEQIGMTSLEYIARKMIDDAAPGIVTSDDGTKYISSFQAFYNYVETKRPHDVSPSRYPPNPFPGILRGDDYTYPAGELHDSHRTLLPSKKYRHLGKDRQFILQCDGALETTL